MTNGWGGVREGAGRPRTAPDGQLRKQRQTRASDDEWEMIKTFAAIVKKDPARAARMMKTE
jgi:hypothetical protein|nr:MAG TPA: hypothetical protein [Caudoviricetes sp.]